MAKQENMKYLEQFVQQNDFESLLTRCFSSEERTIELCANKAFWNVIRGYREYLKLPQPERKTLCANIAKWVAICVDELFAQNVSTQEEFDIWHNEICTRLQSESNKHIHWFDSGLPYGIAQYTLNTAFANMLIMERWDKHLDPIRAFLHVPVNSSVMESAWKDYKIVVPLSSGGVGEYSYTNDEGKISKSYKRWDSGEYIKFQNDVRLAVPSCPIDWAYSIWNKPKQERGGNANG